MFDVFELSKVITQLCFTHVDPPHQTGAGVHAAAGRRAAPPS